MRSLPGRLCALLGVLLVCSCGHDPSLSPTAVGSVTHQAASVAPDLSVVLTLRRGSAAPIADTHVWVRHASNGSSVAWIYGGVTDGRGKCTLPIHRNHSSGYYQFKAAHKDGTLLARWGSIPLNGGQEVHLTLDLNGQRSAYAIPLPRVRRFAIPGGDVLEMVFVSGGRFRMGSAEGEPGRDEDEGPRTGVTLTEGFYVSRCEITQRQWTRVIGTTPWRSFRETAERFGLDNVTVAEDGDFHPAESTGWEGAQTFVDALNAHAGAAVYRLPTEAEWEYFARAGSDDRWSFGDMASDLEDYGWVRGNTEDRAEPYAHVVGAKLPNRWGLYDVYGNVAEWVQDWYRPYRGGHLTDPQGPLSGIHADRGYRSKRVIRGGSFVDVAPRSADRSFADTEGIGSGIGFRLVRIADPIPERDLAGRY